MQNPATNWIVETDWLASRLDAPGRRRARRLDASAQRRPQRRRPNTWPSTSPARCSSTSTTSPTRSLPLPHMLPSTAKFASRMKKMGIGDGMRVIVYDSEGLVLGRARVVDVPRHGPRRRGRAERRLEEMEGGRAAARGRRAAAPQRAAFHAALPCRAGARCRRGEGADRQPGNADRRRALGRAASRAPRRSRAQGLRSGHIPGSRNVPFTIAARTPMAL